MVIYRLIFVLHYARLQYGRNYYYYVVVGLNCLQHQAEPTIVNRNTVRNGKANVYNCPNQ